MVDSGFRKDVYPGVVRGIKERYSVVHGGLVDSSGSPWCMSVNRKSLSEGEEEGIRTEIRVNRGREYGLVKSISTAPKAQRVLLGLSRILVGRRPHSRGSSSLKAISSNP